MNTNLLFLEDSYRKEFSAEILSFENTYVVFDQTCFYPRSGGQECDTGVIEKEREMFTVSEVKKNKGIVLHKIDGVLEKGDKITGKIDWDRRYQMMKYHTALHVLSRVVYNFLGGEVAGNQITPKNSRIHF